MVSNRVLERSFTAGSHRAGWCPKATRRLWYWLGQNWGVESDGSVRIAWNADGIEAIHVYARFWPSYVAAERAQVVADVALTNRTVHDLRRGLRARFGGSFQLQAPDEDAPDRRVAIFFDPPTGTPNPEYD
jgi:hypothetical protein